MTAVQMPPPPPKRDRRPPGTRPLGWVLVLLGLTVFAEWLDVFAVPWHVVLPLTLVFIGGAHFAGARRPRHGGLTVLGMVIVVALATSAVVDVPFADRLTDRNASVTGESP